MLTFFACVALSAAPAPLNLVRGDEPALGPLKIGDSMKAVEALGLKPRPQMTGWYELPPLSAHVVDGVVITISRQLSLAEATALAGVKAPMLEQLAQKLGRCGPTDPRQGGTLVQCEGNLQLAQTLGGLELRVDAKGTPPTTSCDVYVSQTTDVEAKRTYCYAGRVLTSELTLEAVEKDSSWGACESVPGKSSIVRRCRQTHLVFALPNRQLARIELHPGR